MKLNTIMITLAALAGAATAQAVPELNISVGTGSTAGVNTEAAYNNLAATSLGGGEYLYTTPVGLSVSLYASEFGTVSGTGAAPGLDIDAIETSSVTGVPGWITITLSDNDFGPTNGAMTLTYGGAPSPTAPSSVSLAAYYSNTNADFAETTLIASTPVTTYTDVNNPSASGPVNSNGGNYSLTEVLSIIGSGAGTVSVDAGLSSNVPDGATTALLVGAGLLGLGFFASRRKLTVA